MVNPRPSIEPKPEGEKMHTLNSTDEMALGIDKIDSVHRGFLDEMRQVQTAPDEQFADLYLTLVERVERDFREEERLMEEIDYPGLNGHREEHARVLGALHHVTSHVLSGDLAPGREAAELLPQWFLHHISTMDTALAFAVDKHGEARPSCDRLQDVEGKGMIENPR
jgi:hemerythrin-like metal-binding protein